MTITLQPFLSYYPILLVLFLLVMVATLFIDTIFNVRFGTGRVLVTIIVVFIVITLVVVVVTEKVCPLLSVTFVFVLGCWFVVRL
eukprot:m.282961 g.282961  ORF g.282961 m.282961 type:complete len:85 (-) comp127399_c0_seq1:33-287(-)